MDTDRAAERAGANDEVPAGIQLAETLYASTDGGRCFDTEARPGLASPLRIEPFELLDVLVQGGRAIVNAISASGRVRCETPGAAVAAVAAGSTLQVQQAERSSPLLADVAGRLGQLLGGEVGSVHAYMSPTAAPGLAPHRDAIDGFIVQLHGRKRWTVWPWQACAPHTRFEEREIDVAGAESVLDVELTPGDVLRVGRGDPHVAVATGDTSVHLTVGVHRPDPGELARWLVDRAVQHIDAGPLPRAEVDHAAATKWVADVRSDLVGALQACDDAEVLESFLRHRTEHGGAGVASWAHGGTAAALRIGAPGGLHPSQRVAPTLALRVARPRDGVLTFADGSVALERNEEAIVREIADATTPRSLHEVSCRTGSDPDTVVAVVRRLAQHGLVIDCGGHG